MLTTENLQLIETKVLERLDKIISEGEQLDGIKHLAKSISMVATKAAVMTLEEYEKLCENQESKS